MVSRQPAVWSGRDEWNQVTQDSRGYWAEASGGRRHSEHSVFHVLFPLLERPVSFVRSKKAGLQAVTVTGTKAQSRLQGQGWRWAAALRGGSGLVRVRGEGDAVCARQWETAEVCMKRTGLLGCLGRFSSRSLEKLRGRWGEGVGDQAGNLFQLLRLFGASTHRDSCNPPEAAAGNAERSFCLRNTRQWTESPP